MVRPCPHNTSWIVDRTYLYKTTPNYVPSCCPLSRCSSYRARRRRAARAATHMVDANAHGLTELHHDIFADFAEAGDAHFLSRASLLNKAHHAAAKAAWASLSVPVPKIMQVKIARFLVDETWSLPPLTRVDERRVALLLQASGRSLLQLGVSQVCNECSQCMPVPDWGQVCATCFEHASSAEVARRASAEKQPSLQPSEKEEAALLAWHARTIDRLIMWECEACDTFSSNTDPELGAGHCCSSCREVHHAGCKPFCVECNACCCDCDEYDSDDFD